MTRAVITNVLHAASVVRARLKARLLRVGNCSLCRGLGLCGTAHRFEPPRHPLRNEMVLSQFNTMTSKHYFAVTVGSIRSPATPRPTGGGHVVHRGVDSLVPLSHLDGVNWNNGKGSHAQRSTEEN